MISKINSLVPISEWPKIEQPREKLKALGVSNLSDAELLAIIFSTGSQGKTALDLAREIQKKYPSLRQLINTDFQSFRQFQGIGFAKYCQLQASVELGRRYLQEGAKRQGVIVQAQDVKDFLIAHLRHLEEEIFACLFLDTRNQIISFEKIFQGSINTATIHPRVIVKRALYHNAAAIIAAHNHPSGNPEPSQADKKITQQILEALALVEIRLLDHIIVGNPRVASFAELGLL